MSRRVWYCPNCGYEVPSRGRCHSCGERLLASPLPELESGPEDDEVGYRLDQWDDETRGRLIEALIGAGIRHRFEEEELVVLAIDEAEVDALVAEATGGNEAPLGNDGQAAAVTTAASKVAHDLYDAADRLRQDPTDMQADVDIGEASAALFTLDFLPPLGDDELAAVGRVTRRLLGALGADEALEDEIRHQAEVLCRLLARSAGEDVARIEVSRASARLEEGAKAKGRAVALPRSELTPAGEMGATLEPSGEAKPASEALGLAEGLERPASAGTVPASAGTVTQAFEGEAGRASEREAGSAGASAEDLGRLLAGGAVSGQGGEAAARGRPAAATVGTKSVGAELPQEGEPAEATSEDGGTGFEDKGDGFAESESGLDVEELPEEDEEDTGEIVYELSEWLPEQRVELSLLAEAAGVPYSWEGTDLTVAAEHEAEVEALVSQVRGLAEEDDEARYRAIEELFGSVDRLANDPGDEERQQAFLQAVGAVEQPTPVGVDDAFWWRVRSQGHAVVAALEGGKRLDEVSREAALLAEMLHEMV